MLATATCKTEKFLYSSLKWQILILHFVLLVMDMTIRKHLSPKYLNLNLPCYEKCPFISVLHLGNTENKCPLCNSHTLRDKLIPTSYIVLFFCIQDGQNLLNLPQRLYFLQLLSTLLLFCPHLSNVQCPEEQPVFQVKPHPEQNHSAV